MKKVKFTRIISKLTSLVLAFIMFGNVVVVNAMEMDVNQDVIEVLDEENKVEIEEGNTINNEEHENKSTIDNKSNSLDNVVVDFVSTSNSALQIDMNKIRKTKYYSYDGDVDVFGIINNKGNKTYSFKVRANFYDVNGYKYATDEYALTNVRPNEEESFNVWGSYHNRQAARVELYIENVVEIYDSINEDNIKVELKNIEYTTSSNGSNRKTKITANVTNNSDYLVRTLGVKFSLRDKDSRVINIAQKDNIEDLGVGETREVIFEANGIYEDEYSFYKTNITTYKNTDYKIGSIKFSKASPQYVNKEVEIETVMESCGWYDEYKYSIYDGRNWTVLRNWSSDNKFKWKPTTEGDYKIKVEVRTSSSSKIVVTKTADYKIVNPKLGTLNVTLSKNSPQVAGTSINITATSTGENSQYKYEILKGSTTIEKKDYSQSSVYNWAPNEEGTYTINVYSRNKNYTDLYNKKTITYKVTKPSFSLKSFTIDKKAPQATETTLKLNVNTSGSNLLYKYSYYDGKKWNVIKDYSTSKTISWKPTVAGTLKIKVDVKVKNTKYSASKTINYEIYKKGTVTIKSLTADKKSPQPQKSTIKLNTTAVGSDLQYKYTLYNGKKWVTLRDYSSSSSYTWKPNTPYGKYKIKVYVKSKGYTKSYTKELSYNIFKTGGVSITSLKASKTSKVLQYDSVNITAQAKGSYLEYRFKSYDPVAKKWYTEKNFSTSKSFLFYAYSPGTNKIKVEVRQRGCSTIYSKTISLKVYSKPSISVSGKYYYNWYGSSKYLDYGYFDIYNYGNKTVKIKKLEMITNGSVVYKYSPKNMSLAGYGYNTLWYYALDNEKSTSEYINSSTYWTLTYEYDGLTHTHYIYQK